MLWLASQRRTEGFQVASTNLADLEVIPTDPTPAKFEHSPLVSAPSPEPPPVEQGQDVPQQSYVDPAILSIGKPPLRGPKRTDTFATLSEPFNNLSLDANRLETSELDTTELTAAAGNIHAAGKGRRTAKPKRSKGKSQGLDAPLSELIIPPTEPEEKSSAGKKDQSSRTRGRKQKQQASLEIDSLGIIEAGSTRRDAKGRVSRKQKSRISETQNGWATEEATDIQELGDFDFEANLSKFDKREVFRQLKEDDTIEESARLVGHNRVPRAGTAGGRNLHWTENVLETPKAENSGMWNSEAGDTADETLEAVLASGRSSRRDASHSRTRIPSSRKGSTRTMDDVSSIRGSVHIGSFRQPSFETSGSPRVRQKKTPSTSPYVGSALNSRPSLRVQGSNKLCPHLTPLQALEFEQYAVTELGLSEDILMENAARGIAETTTRILDDEKSRSSQSQLVVALVGNHKTGARTLAACRHLRNHGIKVIVSAMSLGRDEDLLETVRRQLRAYTKAGGITAKPSQLLDSLKDGSLNPDILLDAILAAHCVFDDLRRNEQALCYEVIILANRMDTHVVSIDVPSAVDASSGEVTIADGTPLAIHPHTIIALGAPKPYLLAMLQHAGVKDNPQMFVADIGIDGSIWRKIGHKKQRGVDFGTEWVIRLRYQAGVE